METRGKKQPAKRLPDMRPGREQAEQAERLASTLKEVEVEGVGKLRFVVGDKQRLHIGAQPLSSYLEQAQLGWVVKLEQWLEEMDWEGFYRAYKPGGRAPLHPRLVVGLLVYGLLHKQWGLRPLEKLARRDVGAWWLCAGEQPDHSTLGRFCLLHLEILTEEFFLEVTRKVLREVGVQAGIVAADGTVVEAAAGLASLVKQVALEEQVAQARSRAEAEPQNAQAQRTAATLQQAQQVLAQRQQAREQVGKPGESVQVSSSEPEAMVQPRKDGPVRPSYKPCLLVHEKRIIIGQSLHPASETASVVPLLVQHGQVLENLPVQLLLDAGFFSLNVLSTCVQVGVDVLCPSGKAHGQEDFERKGHKGLFAKSAFGYEEASDSYMCPAGHRLTTTGRLQHQGQERSYREYRTQACAGCPLRAQCTQAEHGRKLKRFEGEQYKEAMQQVLQQPAARACYRRRGAIVEPVFAELKERQDLRRFHRRGLRKAAMELALHCIAYNLKQALGSQVVVVRIFLLARLPDSSWLLVDCALLLYAP